MLTATSPDQIALCGLLEDGAVASFHMRAGSGGDPSFLLEIQGEDAVLRVTSTGYLMWRPLTLELWDAKTKHRDVLPPPEPAEGWANVATVEGPAQNVAYAYAAFAQDIRTGSRTSVTFSGALRRRETMEAIRAAAQSGMAKSPASVA